MESTRNPSGLGRGLAGILGDTQNTAPSAAVGRLVGAQTLRRSPEVRQLVTETALSAIADGFGADGVVLLRRNVDGNLDTVTSRLPSGWSALSPVTFEVVGRLWNHLEKDEDASEHLAVGAHHFLLSRHSAVDGVTAAAVVRSKPFTGHEVRTVGTLVRSVSAALSEALSIPADSAIRVLTQDTEDGVLADVRLGQGNDRRHAAAVASEPVAAVARAAAELCDVPLDVSFAGAAMVDDSVVTLVVVTGPMGEPLFGLAIDDDKSSAGAAEAVFAAARILGADPFSVKEPAEG